MNKRRLVALIALVLLVLAGFSFTRYRWHKLPHYVPERVVPFSAEMRTMAEHDAFMQDKTWPYVLHGSRPGLEGSLPDLAAMDRLWEERFADLGPWRTLSQEQVHPAASPNRLQRLANLANEVRDRHAARVILDLMARGERVFAVAGGSHVVKQEPVLRAGTARVSRLSHPAL